MYVARTAAARFASAFWYSFTASPTAALKQEITEKAVSPGRLAIRMRSPICQTSSQVQVFVPEFEPGVGLVGIKKGDLTELLSGAPEVFLAQVRRSQRLMGLAVRRIKLQRTLKKRNGLFWRAQFEIIHSHNYGGAEQVWPFAQSPWFRWRTAKLVFEQALVSKTQVNLSLD